MRQKYKCTRCGAKMWGRGADSHVASARCDDRRDALLIGIRRGVEQEQARILIAIQGNVA